MTGALVRIWLAAASLCAGTWLGVAAAPRGLGPACIVAGATALMVRRRPWLSLSGIALLAAGAGMLNADLRLSDPHPLDGLATDVPRCEVEGTVLEPVGGLGILVDVDSASCATWTATSLGAVALREGAGPPGSGFRAEGWFVPLGADPFDAALQRAGAHARFHTSVIRTVSVPAGAHAVAERVRGGLGVALENVDGRVTALLKGLTIGDTSELAPATIDLFRNAGLSHILAVSGSNVAIVLGAVVVGLRSLGHRVRILFGYTALGLFVLVVGPDPSVVRAAAMGSIGLACLAYGRTAEPLAALGLAVIAAVSLRPGMLFSVGMQLSVAATAGIVVFCAPIERSLHRLPNGFRTMIAATLAAQLAVAPVLIVVFGELSLVAPLANALALPAVALATVLGLAAGSVAVVIPAFGRLIATLVAPAGAWVLAVAERTGALPWALVEIPPLVGWPLLGCIMAWACVLLRPPEAAG